MTPQEIGPARARMDNERDAEWRQHRAITKRTCVACHGGGLAPDPGCTCGGNTHTCTPVICTSCGGT